MIIWAEVLCEVAVYDASNDLCQCFQHPFSEHTLNMPNPVRTYAHLPIATVETTIVPSNRCKVSNENRETHLSANINVRIK